MTDTGTIFSLDLGIRTGFAIGRAGELYRSGTVILKKPDEHRSVAFSNLLIFLNEHWSDNKPAVVVKEAMLPLQAFRHLQNAENTVRMTAGLHAIVEAMCVRFGIDRRHDVADSTVRKHFVGSGRMGSRDETKAAIVKRCHLLGFMPKDCTDCDRADAISVWDFACATWGRSAPRALHMFGEVA